MMEKSSTRSATAPVSKKSKRGVAGLTAAIALQCALLLASGAASALDSSTIVVGQGDTVSALFERARIPQAQLMELLHSSKQIEANLDRVRPGAILSVVTDAKGRLQRLQITSKRGNLTIFMRSPTAASNSWRVIDGEAPVSAKTGALKAPTRAVLAPQGKPTSKLKRAPHTVAAKSVHAAVALRHRVKSPSAETILKAESLVHVARMVAEASAPVELNYELDGMPAKIYAAEQRVQRARARHHLLSLGPKNTRAVMRVAQNRERVTGERRKVGTVLANAHDLLGTPYLWGGTTPNGFDCSGFVVYNLNKVDIRVPRTAHQQFNHTRNSAVAWNDLQPGDLVFFHDRRNRRRIGHVGIFIGDGKFIHAVKKGIPVKITSMNRAYYRKRFVRGGRVIS
jgi:cell wall-associated NlpC family hydrolase